MTQKLGEQHYYELDSFKKFANRLKHGFSLRQNGDLQFQNVLTEAHSEFANLIDIPTDNWFYCNQNHSDIVSIVDKKARGPHQFGSGDGLITNQKNAALLVKVADCQAILIFDPVLNALGLVHNGWRGSVKNIVGKTVKKMEEEFGCEPANLHVGIFPSLGPCCSFFTSPYAELPEDFHKYILSNGNNVDFWQASLDQLQEAGAKSENIELAGVCTKCHADKFFSYRAGDKIAGRMGLLACLT